MYQQMTGKGTFKDDINENVFKNFSDTGVVWTFCLVDGFLISSCDICVEGADQYILF